MSNEPVERGVLQIIRGIKDGTTDPKLLSPDDRRACVGHVISEGLSVVETAQLLKVCERTIRRDRIALQEEMAIDRDPRLAGVVAGRLIFEADTCMQRIRRATREKSAPHAVRVEGERACFSILSELTQRLQSLGYLPTAAQEFTGTVSHTIDDLPSFEETEREIWALRKAIEKTGGTDTEAWRSALKLHEALDRHKLGWGTFALKQQIQESGHASDQD